MLSPDCYYEYPLSGSHSAWPQNCTEVKFIIPKSGDKLSDLLFDFVIPLLYLKVMPGVKSDGIEVGVELLVAAVVDGHGCLEISVGVPGQQPRHSLTPVTTPIIS